MSRRKKMLITAILLGMCGCPTTQPPPVAHVGCRADDDCHNSTDGRRCINRTCTECSENLHCKTGQACEQGRCVALAECSCAQGETCLDGQCVPAQACANGDCDEAGDSIRLPSTCLASENESGRVALRAVRFDFDDYSLSDEAQSVLTAHAECMQLAKGWRVTIEGHCDQRGTQEYNLALGDRRATNATTYLRHLGVATDTVRAVSKGENEPVCSNQSEGCHAQNRRVQILLEQPL